MLRPIGIFLTLTFASVAQLPAAQTTPIVLSLAEDFQLPALEAMPRPPAPHLQISRQDYALHRAAEWQIQLQAGTPQTAIGQRPANVVTADLNSAAFDVHFPSHQSVVLHWNRGSQGAPSDFQPMEQTLSPGQPVVLESMGGRSSDGIMPYFNLATAQGGLILAVGWPGNWRATFEQIGSSSVRIRAGLQHDQLELTNSEAQRLPSILVMAYQGHWLQGQNQFRRLLRQHMTPVHHPEMRLMPVAASVHGMIGFNNTTEPSLTALAAHIGSLKLPLDTFWLDAGWNAGGFPRAQGNPQADPVRFPHGLAPVGEAAAGAGLRFLVWFEPERVMPGTWLDREQPSWLLQPGGTPEHLRYLETDGFQLLDLGNAQARRWAVDSVSEQIRAAGISICRLDFNASPQYFWQTGLTAPQTALREVRYINGLYEFLEELARRHPQLIIDNCASGGRRMDFEMLRRTVVLWRSDSCWDDATYPRNVQAMTHGLSHWIPLHGLGAAAATPTALRSGMGACASFAIPYDDPEAVASLAKHLERYLEVRPLFAEDFYPLTPWSTEPDVWLAFQFHDPSQDQGLIQAFCSADAHTPLPTLRLHGLNPTRHYQLTDWDHSEESRSLSGSELMTTGVQITDRPASGCLVLQYQSGHKDR